MRPDSCARRTARCVRCAVAIGVLLGALAPAGASAQALGWRDVGAGGPPGRVGAAMAFDEARARMVLFGGYGTDGLLADMWEWNGESWYRADLASAQRPPPRWFHAMAYDRARRRVVLFGGDGQSLESPHETSAIWGNSLDDTWEWDGSEWSRVEVQPHPSGRQGHAMTYDEGRRAVLLYGGSHLACPGYLGNGPVFASDLWSWNGTSWSQVAPCDDEPSRVCTTVEDWLACNLCEGARERGEETPACRARFDAGECRATGPEDWLTGTDRCGAPRLSEVFSLHVDASGTLVAFGMFARPEPPWGSPVAIWTRAGNTWSMTAGTEDASRQPRAPAAYDRMRGRVVSYEGRVTWEWDGSAWETPAIEGPIPTQYLLHAMAYDSARARVVLFGGATEDALYESTWIYPEPSGCTCGAFGGPGWLGLLLPGAGAWLRGRRGRRKPSRRAGTGRLAGAAGRRVWSAAVTPSTPKLAAVRARQTLHRAIRAYFEGAGFEEVETPALVPAPGMEPHITAFETRFVPEMGAAAERPLWLHTSPEYAMKRLLADGWERVFQLCKVFRNGEIARLHNPEFTMLEFYRGGLAERAGRGYEPILLDLEELVAGAARQLAGQERISVRGAPVELSPPWDRLPVAEAFASRAGIELPMDGDAGRLRERARGRGFDVPEGCRTFDDVFFSIFLAAIEPGLGWPRPTFLVDWPACMASLARVRLDDPHVAERFELYVAGVELANGFFELNDAAEQRRRLEEEQRLRRSLGRPAYPLDERFLEAVGRMPPSAGVAVGVDRLLMLLGGFASIDDVLLFPARQELA